MARNLYKIDVVRDNENCVYQQHVFAENDAQAVTIAEHNLKHFFGNIRISVVKLTENKDSMYPFTELVFEEDYVNVKPTKMRLAIDCKQMQALYELQDAIRKTQDLGVVLIANEDAVYAFSNKEVEEWSAYEDTDDAEERVKLSDLYRLPYLPVESSHKCDFINVKMK